ncbi:MAG: hypothetical protein R3B13_03475 [Polyangiaceae bacterium]
MSYTPPPGPPAYSQPPPQPQAYYSAPPPPQPAPPTTSSDKSSFDVFELLTALLLGVAALGGAWSGHQSGLWGGNCQTAYGEAANLTTRAGTVYQLGVSVANRDSSLDIQAKQLVLEGMTSQDEVTKLKTLGVAKYLYARQMSEDGYRAVGLPAEFRTQDDDKLMKMPESALEQSLDKDLDEKYFTQMTAPGEAIFAEADKKFDEGRRANQNGDQFGLAVVLYTIALFFGGIALVFKSIVRWGFFGMGMITMLAALIYMARLPSAGWGVPPAAAPAASGSAAAAASN